MATCLEEASCSRDDLASMEEALSNQINEKAKDIEFKQVESQISGLTESLAHLQEENNQTKLQID
jgi:predicted component of type VI protein secretion system